MRDSTNMDQTGISNQVLQLAVHVMCNRSQTGCTHICITCFYSSDASGRRLSQRSHWKYLMRQRMRRTSGAGISRRQHIMVLRTAHGVFADNTSTPSVSTQT